ncbi:cell surface protein [Haloarcula brevis]|uniref:cell surface protein n=1 Tax=Haloarcula brevis TaxID=3111453 RepID=UPI00300EF10A
MTDDTHRSIRGRTARLPLALVALVLLAGTLPALAAGQSDPAISIEAGSVAAGETTAVPVVLTSAPDGLAGYQLELAVSDPGVARFGNASYPDRFGLTTDPVVSSDGGTITLEAADLDGQIEPGATDVTLATVELTGVAGGETQVTVASSQVDADGGAAVEPATTATTVAVTGDATAERVAASETTPQAVESTAGTARTASDAGGAAGGATAARSTTGADGSLPPALVLVAIAGAAALAAGTARRP